MAMSPYGLPRAGRLPNFSQITRNAAGFGARSVPGFGVPRTYGNPYGNATPGAASSNVPDYTALIQSDPGYHQTVQDVAASGVQNERTRSAGTQGALINFGDTGDIAGSLSSLGLDPSSALYRNLLGDVNAAQPFAQNLTDAGLSTTAQMAHDHATNIAGILADAGVRSSGGESSSTGINVGNEAQRYSGAQFDARAKVLSYLAGVQQAYLTAQKGDQGTLADAATKATANIANLYPVTPGAGTTGPSTPPNTAQIGRNA